MNYKVYNYIHLDSLKGFRQKQNLNFNCFLSFKNQILEIYCLACSLVKLATLFCHTIFWGAEGFEGGLCENKANRFLLRMANLLIFIDNGGI